MFDAPSYLLKILSKFDMNFGYFYAASILLLSYLYCKCLLRHVKKIWFSANQARAGLKRLGYVSIYPKKNFKSIAGLEPYHMEGQNFGNLEWLLDFLGFHIIAVSSRVLRINTKIFTLMDIKWHFANTFSELELCVKNYCNDEKSFPI